MSTGSARAIRAFAVEACLVAVAASVASVCMIALYRTIDPSFFVVNDARDASLPQGFEMGRQLADGQLPVFTTRALSGGNHLVGFGSGPLHPLNALVWSLWGAVGTARRMGMPWCSRSGGTCTLAAT